MVVQQQQQGPRPGRLQLSDTMGLCLLSHKLCLLTVNPTQRAIASLTLHTQKSSSSVTYLSLFSLPLLSFPFDHGEAVQDHARSCFHTMRFCLLIWFWHRRVG